MFRLIPSVCVCLSDGASAPFDFYRLEEKEQQGDTFTAL